MDAGMSAASRAQSRRTSMLGGVTPSMRPVGRDTPRSRLHNQLAGNAYDTTPVVPIFDDFVGPGWDAESVATTRAGSTRPPPHPHTTPRHAMQPSVEDAPPSGLNSGLHSPLLGGGVLESKRNSGMETVLEEPVAGPSTFPHVSLSVDPPDGGDPSAGGGGGGGGGGGSRSRASSQRTASSGRRRREGDGHHDQQQDSGWTAFDAQPAGGSGWGDFGGGGGGGGGGDSWGFGDAGGGGGGGGGASGWPDEPPPLAQGLGLSGATASQQGSRRPSDASLYVQDPSQPPSRPRSRVHSRAPSGGTAARSPLPAAPSLAPPADVRSPTLSDMHGANIFHVPVGSPTQATSPPRPSPIRTNITPTRSNPTPARSGRLPAQTPVIARDYALPEHMRLVPLASDGTPRFLPVIPTPPGVSSPARALRDVFVGNGAPRHPAAALQAHPPEPEPEHEPEPQAPQEQPEDEPVVPGKKGFLARVSSMLNRDRAVAKDKPPAPRRVKKKKGKGAVEEMLAEELMAEAGPSTLDEAHHVAEADAGAAAHAEEEERRRAQEEEDRRKATEEDEKRRKEEAELALKAAEEAARLASEEHRRQQEEEQRRRDEEEEAAARERHEAVEAEHAQILSQHGDAPPDSLVEDQADKGKGGWFKRRNTKKLKKGAKPPTPPPPEPSPFNLPPLESAADPGGSSAPFPVPASPQPTFDAHTIASPRPTVDTTAHGHAPTLIEFSGAPHEEQREFVYVPSPASPTRGHGQAYSVHVSTPPGARRTPTQHVYAATAATQTPRLPSTYNMPFPDMRGPGRAPLPRTASGNSGALSFRLPQRSPTATAPATPSVPSAQLLSEHAKVLGQLEGAEAARERAFLHNEERRARLFDEAEDRRRAEAEARRRVIEVWM